MSNKQIFTPFIQLREFDDSGKLLANGKIFFYEAGTTTLGNVYADSVGTPKANPVKLDGAGTAVIYGDPVAYKIRIVDANGVQIFEIDEVFPFGDGTSGNGLGTLAVCLTYAELRALSRDYDAVIVCGRANPADGGEGLFFRSTSVAPDNDGTILVRSGGSRYLRNYSGYIDPRWFGVVYGVAADQMVPLAAALAVGPVQIAGLTYIGQDRHLGGTLRVFSGGFYSNSTPKLYLDGRLEDACPGAFGAGIEVVLGRRVAREIRTSWFATVAQSLCSEYAYAYNVDADANPGINLDIPANYAVDFLGGAKWSFTAGYSVKIANLIYQGAGQILAWDTEDHVAPIDLGGAVSRLEWFGGKSGGAFGIDNRIPMKAALLSGRVDIPEYYRVIDSGTTWNSGKAFEISGAGTLDIDHDFACASMVARDLTITGGAAITVTGVLNLQGATLTNFVQQATSGQMATASVAVPHAYYAVGTGAAIRATDPTTWATMSGPTGVLKGVWAAGRIIIAGSTGQIWKSNDGTSWVSQTLGAGQWNKVKLLNGRWILVGNGGLAYWSLDGDAWNPITTGTTKAINDVEWSTISGYVITGETGMLRTSPDLIAWTARALPGSPTGDAFALTIGASGRLFLSGAFGGAIYYSDDGATWNQTILGVSDNLYGAASSATEPVFVSSTGRVWKSIDNGATWTSTMVGGANFLSVSYKEGDWIFGDADGLIYHSFDLVTFTANDSGFSAPIWGVFTVQPLYAVVGFANSARRSSNGIDWENVTIGISTGNLRNVRQFFGRIVVVGDGGRVYFTNDFRTFTRAFTSVANDIWDVVYHGGKYVIVGSGGLVMHTPDIFKDNPTWTTETPLTSDTLIRAATDTTNFVICSASKTLTGTTVTSLTLTTTLGGGIFRFGSLWIRYGAGGAIYTSTDKETWTKRVSNVTSNLLYATSSGPTVVIASATEITRSNDGITWTASTPVGTLTAVAYNGTRGELGYTTTSGAFYTSINNGASWTLSHTAAAGLYGLFVTSNQTWELVGNSGLWTWSSDLSTWYTAIGVPSVRLYCGDGGTTRGMNNGYFTDVENVMAFGVSGTVVRRDSYSGLYVSDLTTKLGIGADIVACADGVILTSTGTVYKTDPRGSFALAVGVASANLSALYHDTTGKRIYATGSDTWSSSDVNGNYLWEKEILSFSGVQDMEFRDGKFWAAGASGLLLSSTSGNVWKSQSPVGDTTTHYSVDLARAGLSALLPWARTMAIGSRTVIAGTGGLIQSGAGVAVPAVTANRLDATDATATVDIATEVPGSILRSSLRNVTHIGQTFDSSFSRFSGFLHGNTARTNFVFGGTATVSASIIMAEGSLSKTDTTDSTRAPMFALGSSRLQVDLCTIEPNGALVYSIDTGATILLNDCQNSGNFAFPLTNGYAKIYLNRCGNAVRNPSAYSIDGVSMEPNDSLTLYANATISDTVVDWCGLPAGSTSNGTTITLGAAMPLAPSLASTETLRYYGPSTPANDSAGAHTPATPTALGMLLNLGGRLKMTVEYPNGYTPDPKCRPAIKLVRPLLEWMDPKPGNLTIYGGALNSSVSAGVVTPSGISSTAGKAIAYANVWGGMQSTFIPDAYKTGTGYGGSDRYGFLDQWGDGGYINGFTLDAVPTTRGYTRSARVVIYNEGTGELPTGTKITVEVIPMVPKSATQFASFFGDPDTSYDAIQKVEKQSLAFRDGLNGIIQVVRALNASSAIQTEKQYLSLGTQPSGGGVWTGPYPKDSFTVAITLGLVSTSFIHPTDKSEIFRHVASCAARVDILLPGLDVSNLTTGTYSINGAGAVTNQEFSATTGFDTTKVMWYHRLDRHIIEDGAWDLVSRSVLKHPEGITP